MTALQQDLQTVLATIQRNNLTPYVRQYKDGPSFDGPHAYWSSLRRVPENTTAQEFAEREQSETLRRIAADGRHNVFTHLVAIDFDHKNAKTGVPVLDAMIKNDPTPLSGPIGLGVSDWCVTIMSKNSPGAYGQRVMLDKGMPRQFLDKVLSNQYLEPDEGICVYQIFNRQLPLEQLHRYIGEQKEEDPEPPMSSFEKAEYGWIAVRARDGHLLGVHVTDTPGASKVIDRLKKVLAFASAPAMLILVNHTNTPQEQPRHFVVSGRFSGDEEDTTYSLGLLASEVAARHAYVHLMHLDRYSKEATENEIEEGNDNEWVINSVLSSASPIEGGDVISEAGQAFLRSVQVTQQDAGDEPSADAPRG